MKNHFYLHYFSIFISVLILSCSKGPVSGIEISNGGECTGTIFNADSTYASGAVVRLIPVGFNPLQPSNQIDSTFTDKNGQYSFNVNDNSFYSINAEKENASCFIDSIKLQSDSNAIVNGVLEESGFLKGSVTVLNGDSPIDVVILIRGTTIYTSPYDSTGRYLTPHLPSGSFSVQFIFTGRNEYGIVDTTVTILQGDTTTLNVILPSSYSPTIKNVSIVYDTVTMFATISWSGVDTSKFINYMLSRKSSSGKDTTVLIDKQTTSYTDDLVKFEFDTITYEITAVDKSFNGGYATTSQTIIPVSNYRLVKVITLPVGDILPQIVVDTFENIYVYSYTSVKKIDKNGNLISTYTVIDSDYCSYKIGCMGSDPSGNIFLLSGGYAGISDSTVRHAGIVKLDSNFNTIKSIDVSGIHGFNMIVLNFEIFLFCPKVIDNWFDCTPPLDYHIAKFDADLNLISEYDVKFNHRVTSIIPFIDGFGILDFSAQNSMIYYDKKFNLVTMNDIFNSYSKYVIAPLGFSFIAAGTSQYSVNSRGEFFLAAQENSLPDITRNGNCRSTLLIAGNRENQLLSRRFIERSTDMFQAFYSGLNNNFYQYARKMPESGKIYKYQLMK